MLLLPTFNAQFRPCPVSAAAFSPHAQGQFCSQCQRVVQDFSQSQNPVADLAAARAAAPDGRVCGSFAVAQVQRPKLTQRLRWFVVALVLVVAQGLTAREALAQVRKARQTHSSKPVDKRRASPAQVITEETYGDVEVLSPKPTATGIPIATYAEQMPEATAGGGMTSLVNYVLKNIHLSSTDRPEDYGKVYVEFIVTTAGAVSHAHIVKSSGSSSIDTAVLQAANAMKNLRPAQQNGKPVRLKLTLPISCIKTQ